MRGPVDQDRLADIEALVGTSQVAGREELLNAVIDRTRAATGTQVCSLYLWDEGSKRLALTATNGLAKEGIGVVKMRLGQGVTGWVAKHRHALAVPDTRAEPRFHWIQGLDQNRFTSMLSVPVLAGERLVGVLNVQTEEQHDFSHEEVVLLTAIAGHVAGIVEEAA